MKMLLSHGFYSGGKLFGAEVCGEYIRRYSPSEESVVVRGIENSTLRGDVSGIRKAHEEIGYMLKRESPDVFLDIQTVGSAPIPQQEMREGVIGRQLAELGMDLSREGIPIFDEIVSEILQLKLAGLRRMFTDSVKYAFLNPNVNPSLYQCLADQNFAYDIVKSPETLRAVQRVVPSVRISNEEDTSYIALIAAVNEDGERVIEDEFKKEAFERTINFIHTVRQYVNS